MLWETAALSVVRAGLWFTARHYCKVSLFADLRSVSEENDIDNAVLESPTRGMLPLEDASSNAGSKATDIPPPASRTGKPGLARRESLSPGPKLAHATQNDLATAVFGLAFSESGQLFILLLFGDAVTDRYVGLLEFPSFLAEVLLAFRSRALNWSISLLALLSLIVLIIPLGLSLLLVHRKKSPSVRTLAITLVPFSGYLLLFDRVGSLVASKVVVEGSHSLGELTGLLSISCTDVRGRPCQRHAFPRLRAGRNPHRFALWRWCGQHSLGSVRMAFNILFVSGRMLHTIASKLTIVRQ